MYAPLYLKTDNSLLTSMIRINDLISFALKNDIKALTITDNNMYGVMDFYKACKKSKIKPIIGLEITSYVIVLYAMNNAGYKNLVKLATIQSERSLTISDLQIYSDNLVCILPFNSIKYYDELKKVYQNIYKSYSNNEEIKIVGNNSVYMNEILCLNEKDNSYLKYLEAIKRGIVIEKVDNIYANKHLLLEKEIDFNLDNNRKIIDMCNVTIDHQDNLLPVFADLKGTTSYSYLRKLCKEGLKRKFGETVNKNYIERLNYELEIINKMGFCDYFLIVYDYVKYAKENDILVGPGRGSAASSLVSYLLDIITIDPLKYDLIFERFLNIERISMPDIDIDFEDIGREKVINYCIEKYGLKKVVPIIAFGTMGSKAAIRDVGRSIDVDIKLVNQICANVDSSKSLIDNLSQNRKLKNLFEIDNDLKNLYKIAIKFEGLKRHTTIHAAGVVMSNRDIDEIIPLDKNHDNFYTTAYSMDYLEEIGLLKMDFLAISNLTLIHNILKQIPNLSFDTIPLNDSRALELFKNGDTKGIFQFEKPGMINFLRKLKPTTFEDIYTALALYRPGPMKNIPSYINRREGKEKIDYIDDCLINVLKPTYGILVYQEQIIQTANIMASYSLGEADILRKAMSKKKEDILIKEKDKFIDRCIKNGHSLEVSLRVYSLILKFAEYGFNKAHSVSYAMIAYKMAYLKANYKELFMTNLLTTFRSSEHKVKEYVYECKNSGIKILKPDINYSTNRFETENKMIRYPLLGIKGLGNNTINSIVEERKNGLFKDIFDFLGRCSNFINKKIFESLIDASCFDSFYNKNTLHSNIDALLNYGELASYLDSNYALKPEITICEEYDKKELMSLEKETFGLYLSDHPVVEYRNKNSNLVPLSNLNNYFDKIIKTVLYVEKIKEVTTKDNKKMAFITGSDELTVIDAVMFPKIYENYLDLKEKDIIYVMAKVEKRFDKLQLVISNIKVINDNKSSI